MPVAEELYFNVPGMAGDENPRVRADMVYYPTPKTEVQYSPPVPSLTAEAYPITTRQQHLETHRKFIEEIYLR